MVQMLSSLRSISVTSPMRGPTDHKLVVSVVQGANGESLLRTFDVSGVRAQPGPPIEGVGSTDPRPGFCRGRR